MTEIAGKKTYIVVMSVLVSMLMIWCSLEVQGKALLSGTINGTYVNIRTSAGTAGNANKLTYRGNYVQLTVGDEVRITGEAHASDGALWYKIKFDYEGVELKGYVHSNYVDVEEHPYETDSDFEDYLTTQGFPESYKPALRELHNRYPNWVFQADVLDYTWEEVVEQESILARNLVWHTSISSWKSLAPGAYDWDRGCYHTFDGASWVSASKELIAYALDPRNFMDEKTVFMFELLSFNSSIHKEENVDKLLKGTFMEHQMVEGNRSYGLAFMEAAAESGVSPYHLVSRVIQEVGTAGTTGSVSGEYHPTTGNVYKGLYNYYNIGAYAHDGRGAVENGLIYASKTDEAYLRPWNSRYRAIVGGAVFIGKGYIGVGQDTLYYEKFDLVGTPYTHQYMSNILAPKQEAIKMSNAYTQEMKDTIPLIFKIPVYQEMPEEVCPCPTGDGSPNNILEQLEIQGFQLTPTFQKFRTEYDLIVKNSVKKVKISCVALDGKATITGAGSYKLKVGTNVVPITVTADNGEQRVYTLTIVRKSDKTQTGGEHPTTEQPESTTKPSESATKPGGVETTVPQEPTGMEEQTETSTEEQAQILRGDVNGDGERDIVDMLYIKRHILGFSLLTEKQQKAADINGKDGVDIVDLLYLKRHILGFALIDS